MSPESEPPLGIDEAIYEREKVTRVMPQDLKLFDACILRLLMPLKSRPPYAFDQLAYVVDIDRRDISHEVSIARVYKNRTVMEKVRVPFSDDGFILTDNSGVKRYEDLPEGMIPVGYFLGSTDPYDLAMSELTVMSLEGATA